MDINTKLDGFVVHPLDLFSKTHHNDVYQSNSTANLDGFNIHPIDSFLNQTNDNSYLNLNNAITTYDGITNTGTNDINQYINGQNFNQDLYNPYSNISYETKNLTQDYIETKPIVNNTISYDQYPDISTTYLTNFGSSTGTYDQYNISPYTNSNISYDNYPTTISTNYTGTNIQNYDYLFNNTYKESSYDLSQIPTSTLSNFTDNYINNDNTSTIYPNYTTTNEVTSNGISFDNYSTPINYIPSSTTYNLLNSNIPYSFQTNSSYLNTLNNNIFPSTTLNNVSTFTHQPNSIYNIYNYTNGIDNLNVYPKTITHQRRYSAYNSTPRIPKNNYESLTFNPTISLVHNKIYPTTTTRAHSVPRRSYHNRTTFVIPNKTKVILPSQIIQNTNSPLQSNYLISTFKNNKNTLVIPNQNILTIPTYTTYTYKNPGVLAGATPQMSLINGYSAKTFRTPNIVHGGGNVFSSNQIQFSPIKYTSSTYNGNNQKLMIPNNTRIYRGTFYKPKNLIAKKLI